MTGSRDPTRSQGLRREGRGKVTKRVFELQRGLRQAVQDGDVAGLRAPPVPWLNWHGSAAHRLTRSQMIVQATVDTALTTPSDWLSGLIARAIQKGVDQAAQELRVELGGFDISAVNDVHTFAAMSEVNGIAHETVRRTIRHIGDAIERKQTPEALMRELRGVLEKITKLRLNLLVNTSVVRAVNAGKLATYKSQGIRQVGVIPEWMPAPRLHDHVHDAVAASRTDIYPEDESYGEFMERCSAALGDESECELIWNNYVEAEVKPKARRTAKQKKQAEQTKQKAAKKAQKKKQAAKKAQEREDETQARTAKQQVQQTTSPDEYAAAVVSLVNVLTAGDDRVCDDCDQIAAEGPYDIDTAQDLIPAHPLCRCAFVPFGDARFAPIEEQEE